MRIRTLATRKNLLPAAFIFLVICFAFRNPDMARYTILGKLLAGVVTGLFSLWIGSGFCWVLRNGTPRYANYVGVVLYWLFIAMLLYMAGGIAYFQIYLGYKIIPISSGLWTAAVFWVFALGARRGLTTTPLVDDAPEDEAPATA